MAWPFSRLRTYVNSFPPTIDGDDLNAMQDRIASLGTLPIFFGTGADGSATLDGATTPSFASRSGSTYTLLRDAHCINLTINSGVTLKTAGFRLFCQGTLTLIDNTSAITHDGGAGAAGVATGAAGGAAAVYGSIGGGAAGGTGAGHTSGVVGAGADSTPAGLGGFGGDGGAGSAAPGGAGGSVIAPTVGMGSYQSLFTFLTGFVIGYTSGSPGVTMIKGGSGGGGGNSGDDGIANGSNGGAGGGSGGVIEIWARNIVNNGLIGARGGAGGNATTFAGTGYLGGGGAGGGGGVLFLAYGTYSGTGSLSVAGGAAGLGDGGGPAGQVGGDGHIYQLQVCAA